MRGKEFVIKNFKSNMHSTHLSLLSLQNMNPIPDENSVLCRGINVVVNALPEIRSCVRNFFVIKEQVKCVFY